MRNFLEYQIEEEEDEKWNKSIARVISDRMKNC